MALSSDDFDKIVKRIKDLIIEKGNVLTFTILRACTNCTYGRFDDDFEKLILCLRDEYPVICKDKDLTLGDPKHQELHTLVCWDEKNPIFHHIHGRSNTGNEDLDKQWEAIFRGPERAEQIADKLHFGSKVKCVINFEE